MRLMDPKSGGRIRMRAPTLLQPKPRPVAEALEAFLFVQDTVRGFILENADLDLARLRFRNPFTSWIRFSLATGLSVIAAHNEQHLLQAVRVRRALDAGFLVC